MELIPLLSTIILAATIVTIVFAAFSYVAYRAREKKAPKVAASGEAATLDPQFFKRYEPPR